MTKEESYADGLKRRSEIKLPDRQMPEPLAVLADRKGARVTPVSFTVHHPKGRMEFSGYRVGLAEPEARQYLESLPDREGA